MKEFINPIQKNLFNDFKEVGLPNRKSKRWQFTPIANFYKELEINSRNKNNNTDQLESLIKDLKTKKLWDKDDQTFKFHLSQISEIKEVKLLKEVNEITTGDENHSLRVFETKNKDSILIETVKNLKSNNFYHSSNIISVNEGHTLTHVQVIEGQDQSSVHQNWTKVQVKGKKTNYTNIQIFLNKGLYRSNPSVIIEDESSHCDVSSFYYSNNKNDYFDLYSQIKHLSSDTTSEQIVKGILTNTGKVTFTGNIFIDHGLKEVSANQFNQNLLLSDNASAVSQPQLEIFSDDVKCTHGSTTGELDSEQVFYLQSRGFSKSKAQKSLAISYGLEIINKIPNQEIVKNLTRKIEDILGEINV